MKSGEPGWGRVGLYTGNVKKLLGNSLTLTAAVTLAAAMTMAGTAGAQASGTAVGTAAAPKTATTTTHTATTTTHKASTTGAASRASTTALPKNIPVVHGIVKTAYSLKYEDYKVGTGAVAPATGYFTVHYTGWLASDGKKFDSSVDRGEPITFPVGGHRVIPGWDTGFAGMRIGGKRRLFIPYQLAYGEQGRPPVIPAKSDLIFDVELISVSDKPPAPKPGEGGAGGDRGMRKPGTPSGRTPPAGAAPAGSGTGSGAGSGTTAPAAAPTATTAPATSGQPAPSK